ncbi:GTP-binding protein (EngA), partial [mine drainage metagenome]
VIDFVRASGKPAVFVVNKIDGVNAEARLMDFYQHGVSPLIGISAAHGRNINEVLTPFIPLMTEEAEETLDVPIRFTEEAGEDARKWIARRQLAPARVAIVGRPNVGKSTLVNRILGSERLVTSPIPGTTRDAIDTLVHWGDKDYHLIDTAGLRKRGKVAEASELYAQIRTEQAIINSEISIVLLSAEDGLTDGDLRIIREVIDKRRGLILAWNKVGSAERWSNRRKSQGICGNSGEIPFSRIRTHVFLLRTDRTSYPKTLCPNRSGPTVVL